MSPEDGHRDTIWGIIEERDHLRAENTIHVNMITKLTADLVAANLRITNAENDIAVKRLLLEAAQAQVVVLRNALEEVSNRNWLKSKIRLHLQEAEIAAEFTRPEYSDEQGIALDPQDIDLLADMLSTALTEDICALMDAPKEEAKK